MGYHLVRPPIEKLDALALRGLRVLMGGPESAPGVPAHGRPQEVTQKVEGFLAYAESIKLNPTRQVLALSTPNADAKINSQSPDAALIVGMTLWVPASGRTAVFFCPGQSDYPESAPATQATLSAALEDARAAGVVLVQAILEPADAAGKTVYAAAGFSQLALLTYMERRPPVQPLEFTLPANLSLAAYEPRTHPLFREVITASYQQTLDCPALSGMRQVDDVIEGHKAVGIFDPQLWSILLQRDAGAAGATENAKPLGCVLLAEIPARRGLELVYLGLAPEARGRGLGRLLMQRVLAIASRRNFEVATLAVDSANAPALRLYRRFGYSSVAQRIALIRRLP